MKKSIVVYGRQDCPYCDKAKQYLEDLNEEYQYIDISFWSKELREQLKSKYSVKTVPVIIIDGKLIGGYNDLIHQFHLI